MNINKPKLNLLVGIIDFRVGGAQRIVSDVICQLDQDKFEIHLVTLFQFENTETMYDQLPDYVNVHKLHFKSFTDFKSWFQTYSLVKKIRPNVIWSHLYFSNTVFRILKLFFWNIKIIINEHNTYVGRKNIYQRINYLLSKLTYKIVAVSDSVKDYVVKTEGIDVDKIDVIPNGINIDRFERGVGSLDQVKSGLGFVEEDRLIISVGQLIRQKNHRLLVEAFSSFVKKYPNYRLVIAGEGTLKGELDEQIISLQLEDKVKLLGIRKDLGSLYQVSDFFVLPSKFEGFGIVAIEAMASGLPVISSRVAGPDAFIKDNENGLFFDLTAEDLLRKMELLAERDVVTVKNMTASARATAKEFDIKMITQKYEALFEQASK